MDAEQELVFAKYLVNQGLAPPAALKECLRLQARKSADGAHVSLTQVLAEHGLLDASVLRGYEIHFESNLHRCERCTAWFYAPNKEVVAHEHLRCRRCSAAARGEPLDRAGMTGAFRLAQRGQESDPLKKPTGSPDTQGQESEPTRGSRMPPPTLDPPPQSQESRQTREPEPTDVVGDYRVLEVIARGGMGVVYKAQHLSLGRVVALKVLRTGGRQSESHVRRFEREARSVAKLAHPNIVQIHELGTHEGQPYFTMDLVDGVSLEQRLEEPERDLRHGVEVVRDIAVALACAHENGVIHRDVKPANILIDRDGVAKITDFGLASNVDHKSALTQEGELLGTPLYMSPEQLRGRVKEIDERSDLYALGTVLYQYLTGQLPFPARTMVDLQYRVLHDEPERPSTLSPRVDRALETITLKCMEKDRAARYQTARALADDLSRWLAGETIAARPASLVGRTIRRIKRKRGLVLGIVGICLMLAAGASVLLWLESSQRQKDLDETRRQALSTFTTESEARATAVEAALEQAEAALRQRRTADARDALSRAADRLAAIREAAGGDKLQPEQTDAVAKRLRLDALERRGLLLTAQNEARLKTTPSLQRALPPLHRLLARNPADLEALSLRAEVERDLGNLDQAAESALAALALEDSAGLHRLLGEIRLAQERFEDADRELGLTIQAYEAGQANPGGRDARVSLFLLRAEARIALDQLDQASEDVAKALTVKPNASHAYVVRAGIAATRNERFKAARDYDKAVEYAEEGDIEPQLTRGRFLFEQGYYQRAWRDLDTAAHTDDSSLEAYLWRGHAQYMLLRADKAVRDFEHVAEEGEGRTAVQALSALGRLHRAHGRGAEALDAYEQAFAIDPAVPSVRAGRARALLEVGRVEDARAALSDREAEGRPEWLVTLGLIALEANNSEEALARFDAALVLRPRHLEALYGRARALRGAGQHASAQQAMLEAGAGRTEAPDVRNFFREGRKLFALAQRAEMALDRDDYLDRAERAFTCCVHLVPGHVPAHLMRARALALRGAEARGAALGACEAALAQDPQCTEALLLRARLRIEDDQPGAVTAAAKADLAAVLNQSEGEEHARARTLLGRAYLRDGEVDNAIRELERGAKGSTARTHRSNALEALAKAYAAKGLSGEAEAAREGAALARRGALSKEARRLEGVARRYVGNEPRQAIKRLNEAIALEPEAGELFALRTRAYVLALDQRSAIRDLSVAVALDLKQGPEIYDLLRSLTSAFDWAAAFAEVEAAADPGGKGERNRLFLRSLLYVLRIESGAPETGDHERGVNSLTEVLELEPTLAAAYCFRGLLLLRSNDLSAAKQDLSDAFLLVESALPYVYLAGVQAQDGNIELAFETLETAIVSFGFDNPSWLERDPALAPLRAEPRWRTLLERN
ncbi:MAG: protein kinase domain-containing protein [Planctomycetota bacterium]